MSRCEEEGGRLLSSQQVVGEELENGRQVCQHLITELEDLDREIEHGQDRRREVQCAVCGMSIEHYTVLSCLQSFVIWCVLCVCLCLCLHMCDKGE